MIPVLRRAALLAVAALSTSMAGDGRQTRDSGGAPGRGVVSGVVTGSNGPVTDATVTLTGSTWRRLTATSDAAGRFTFGGLRPDVYILTASKDEYLETAYGASRPINQGGMPTGIAIPADQRIEGLTLRLIRGGAIDGIVRDADGRPAAETMVMLAVRHRAGVFGMARTDGEGTFRIAGLPGADYDVIAYPPKGSAPVYYPGVTNPARAESVPVAEDAPDRHVEFALVLAPPVRVSGIVRNRDGQPAAGAQVAAMSPTGPYLRATTTSDGRFVLDQVVPGRYTLEARAPARAGDPADAPISRGRWATAEIDVAGDAVDGVVLTLQPLLLFSGRVEFDRRAALPPIDPTTVRVFLTRPGFHPAEITVGRDGTFAHATTPGVHLVSAIASSSGARLRSAMAGGRDLLDLPPTFDPSTGDVVDVVLTFTDRETELGGRVVAPDDAAVPDCFVLVFPADRALWTAHSRRLTVARPATDGRYVFRDLPAGDYLLAVVRDLEPESWKTPEFLSAIAATGVKIRVVEGGRTQQELRASRATAARSAHR